MSDNIKLVIDLSEEQRRMVDMMLDIPPQVENDLISAIRHGTPLSEALAEIKGEFIERYPKNYMGEPELGGATCHFSLNKVLQILDSVGKGE